MTNDLISEVNYRNTLRRKGIDMRKLVHPVYNREGPKTLAYALRASALRRKRRQTLRDKLEALRLAEQQKQVAAVPEVVEEPQEVAGGDSAEPAA